MGQKKLPNVTLVIADCYNYGKALASLKMSLKEIDPERIIFFTDIDLKIEDERIEIIHIASIKSKQQYSHFILKDLAKWINTDYVLVTQWDGYVLDANQWTDQFLEYDYIGAPWNFEHGRQIGNGGFSLRSKKLCDILASDELINVTHPEDQSVGIVYRPYLEKTYGIKFPDEELADRFAYELRCPVKPTFGFHAFHHESYKKTVVIHRKDAMGDVIHVEPVLHHFYKKGYRVVLDTLPQFFAMFVQHYFKVHHPEEIDSRLMKAATVYNLDLSYETTPRQLHLKTYYDFCEVPESEREYRNPILNLNIPHVPQAKFFKKYCVIHIDRREGGRDIQGNVNWTMIAAKLEFKGYIVIQIGLGEHEDIVGAIRMNTPTELMLMWLIRGADLFIGADSGPANIAVSFGVPSVILFGAVAPKYIYADFSNIEVVQFEDVCRSPKCWHSVESTQGVECVEDKQHPPCVQFTTEQVQSAIDNIVK